jgi:heme-degrading monooxygenase HmoA
MTHMTEMDPQITLADQLQDTGGPVILINKFEVAPTDTQQFLAAWAADGVFFKQQPGFISAQLHRGIAGSGVFINYAVWESADHFRRASGQPEFRANLAHYPASVVASPHLFRKVAVPGICVAA